MSDLKCEEESYRIRGTVFKVYCEMGLLLHSGQCPKARIKRIVTCETEM